MKLAAFSLAALALAAPLAAAQGLEVSGGYSNLDADGANIGALTGRATYFFTNHLGVEGEASFGIQDDDIGAGTVELSNSFGGFGVVRAPISEQFQLHGRVGYATSEFELSVPGLGSGSGDVDGVAYGVGAKYFVTEQFGLRGDFTRFDGDDGEADVLSVAAVLRF